MNKFIKANPKLNDILSEKARNNLNIMVDYLCSSIVPDERPTLTRLETFNMQECHDYISKILYTKENIILANYILQKFSEISDSDCIKGSASIYDLNRQNLIRLSSKSFFESVAVLEHEMIHILLALNNNNPEEQYSEILSIFGELLSLELLSEKYNNNDIYINNLITRCVARMSYRVQGRDFEDAAIENEPYLTRKLYISSYLLKYNYMLGFIYAIRLLDIYHQEPNKILTNFNSALAGEKNVKTILSEYHVSLEDKDTVDSFIKMVDLYRECVDMKYGTSVHRVK